MGRVLGLLVAQLGQVPDAAPGHVAQVVERAALRALDGVEQHALAQRVLADTCSSSTPKVSSTPSRMRAPARMMSARSASSAGDARPAA